MTLEGSGPAILRMLDAETMETVELVANVMAPWTGSRVVDVPVAGLYAIDVAADGPWSVRIILPTTETVATQTAPATFSGNGSSAIYYVSLPPGAHAVHVQHDGTGAFVVTAHVQAGGGTIPVVREIGPLDFEANLTIVGSNDALILLDVQADGAWTISID